MGNQPSAEDTIAAEASALFRTFDTDTDGWLDLDELRAGLADSGLPDDQIEEIFFSLDYDARGYVGEEMFIARYQKWLKPHLTPTGFLGYLTGTVDAYEPRGTVIPEGEHRAIRVPQLHSLAVLAKQLLAVEGTKLFDSYSHKRIRWPTMNM